MRLAIIDHKICDLAEEYVYPKLVRGFDISIDCSHTLELFEQNFGPLSNYDGALIHPGIDNQRIIGELISRFPDLPIGVVTYATWDYDKQLSSFPFFSFREPDPERLYQWLCEFRQRRSSE